MTADAGAAIRRCLTTVWRRVGAPRRILLAVSGGGDSMALLQASSALKEAGAHISVAVVDHGLRAAAREEAAFVANAAGAMGVDCAVLQWRGPHSQSGLQAAARRARYRLLAEVAARLDASLMTGHTLDDQAETFAMRLARGAGPVGLAAMAERAQIAAGAGRPVDLLRPFLTLRRSTLRAFLDAEKASFCEDPSNDDAKFERVRFRAMLQAFADGRFGANAVNDGAADVAAAFALSAARFAEAQRTERAALEAAFRAAGGVFLRWGGASLDAARLEAALADTPEVFAALCARLAFAAGGGSYAPGREKAGRVGADALSAGRANNGSVAIAGAMFERRRRRLFVYREPAALLGRAGVAPAQPISVAPGERVLFDNRCIIANALNRPATATIVGALDAPQSLALLDGPPNAAASTPALIAEGVVMTPHNAGRGVFQSLSPERFEGGVARY